MFVCLFVRLLLPYLFTFCMYLLNFYLSVAYLFVCDFLSFVYVLLLYLFDLLLVCLPVFA